MLILIYRWGDGAHTVMPEEQNVLFYAKTWTQYLICLNAQRVFVCVVFFWGWQDHVWHDSLNVVFVSLCRLSLGLWRRNCVRLLSNNVMLPLKTLRSCFMLKLQGMFGRGAAFGAFMTTALWHKQPVKASDVKSVCLCYDWWPQGSLVF